MADLVVDGDSVGPADADVHHDQPLGAVQTRALDAGVLTPLCPEQIPAAPQNNNNNTEVRGERLTTSRWGNIQKPSLLGRRTL